MQHAETSFMHHAEPSGVHQPSVDTRSGTVNDVSVLLCVLGLDPGSTDCQAADMDREGASVRTVRGGAQDESGQQGTCCLLTSNHTSCHYHQSSYPPSKHTLSSVDYRLKK